LLLQLFEDITPLLAARKTGRVVIEDDFTENMPALLKWMKEHDASRNGGDRRIHDG
jgi:hypothetical protein